jgi:hypothetical protein
MSVGPKRFHGDVLSVSDLARPGSIDVTTLISGWNVAAMWAGTSPTGFYPLGSCGHSHLECSTTVAHGHVGEDPVSREPQPVTPGLYPPQTGPAQSNLLMVAGWPIDGNRSKNSQ